MKSDKDGADRTADCEDSRGEKYVLHERTSERLRKS